MLWRFVAFSKIGRRRLFHLLYLASNLFCSWHIFRFVIVCWKISKYFVDFFFRGCMKDLFVLLRCKRQGWCSRLLMIFHINWSKSVSTTPLVNTEYSIKTNLQRLLTVSNDRTLAVFAISYQPFQVEPHITVAPMVQNHWLIFSKGRVDLATLWPPEYGALCLSLFSSCPHWIHWCYSQVGLNQN